MPAKDLYHDSVKNALIKDGWTITQPIARPVMEVLQVAVMAFDPQQEVIVQWVRP